MKTDRDEALSVWPTSGQIEFQDVSLRYRPASPIILKGVSFLIHPQEKLGIVGRTGSGKSSLIQALFRIVELNRGHIFIDGIDIATLGLTKLRRAMTLIPQDPLLFQGSMQDNIDPFHYLQTDQITAVLDSVSLGRFSADSAVQETGGNLSSGEKQLVCIARASVSRVKILLMDEATSSVDPVTDGIIQRLITEKFQDCTILTIAHRLNTVLQSDRILVMDDGVAKEMDAPQTLLRDPESLFAKLASQLPG